MLKSGNKDIPIIVGATGTGGAANTEVINKTFQFVVLAEGATNLQIVVAQNS